MFGAIFDILMAPVNFVRRTFGWLPEEEVAEVELVSATEANDGPSASTFAAMRRGVVTTESSLDLSTASGLSIADTSMPAPVDFEFEGIITEEDWQTLSMQQIDAKLVANGKQAIGDAVNDPFYTMTPQEVDALTDAEFEALLASAGWDDLEPVEWEGVLTDDDWATLSMEAIDAKLIAAGLDPIGDPLGDPFYSMTPDEIDALSDEEYFAYLEGFGWGPVILPAWDGVLTDEDFATLSPAAIDEKLEEAGFEGIGIEESPFYFLSPDDVQLLPDSAYEALIQQEMELMESLGFPMLIMDNMDDFSAVSGPAPELDFV